MRRKRTERLTLRQLLRPMLWRALLALMIAVCAIVAIYQFTVAGSLALEAQYGIVPAKLLIGGLYIALGFIAWVGLWALRTQSAGYGIPSTIADKRKLKAVMLAEAVMLGFALARKATRA